MSLSNQFLKCMLLLCAINLVALHHLSEGHADPGAQPLDDQTAQEILAREDGDAPPTPSLSVDVVQTPPQLLPPAPAQSASQKIIALEGLAHNFSVNMTDQVEIKILRDLTDPTGKTFIAQGAFRGRNLFGRFRIPGHESFPCAGGYTCLIFNGDIDLSGQGGWPPNTYTTFAISLVISPSDPVVRGVYDIGVLTGVKDHQYGQLTLKMTQ